MSVRYIPPIEARAERQMAIDEAILRSYDEGECPPTIRFFRFKPSAITIGYSHDVQDVIHEEECKDLDIPFVRRATGGGTVFHDHQGEITYSMVTEKVEGNIEDSFYQNLKPIIKTLENYELDAKFKPYNDILVNGKKISGSAQRRGKRGLLQHGTLMYATDIETLTSILKIDEDKLKEKGASSFSDLVTTIEDETGWKPDPEELIQEMKEAYASILEVELEEGELTDKEKESAKRLEEKYGSEGWTYDRRWG